MNDKHSSEHTMTDHHERSHRTDRRRGKRSWPGSRSNWSSSRSRSGPRGMKVVVLFEGRDAAGQGRGDQAHRRAASTPVSAASSRSASPPTARGRSGTSSATSPTCPPPGRSSCSTAVGTTGPASSRSWASARDEEYKEFLRSCPEFERMLVRSGHHPAEVLVLGQRRGAGTSLPGAHREPAQALEAQRDGHPVTGAVGGVLQGQGRDVPAHRHQAGAVVRS